MFNYHVTSLQASDFYVQNLPLLPKDESAIHMHAGYLPVGSKTDGELFFWHFAKKFIGDKPRTIIWLNGGPGQSSLIGAWTEIGPFRFLDKNTIVTNNGSWHLYANLLFIDQPIGTGFSYIDSGHFIKELDEMAEYFLNFLDRYVEIFPELLKQDIYLAGESFGGQYIPYIAQAILENRSSFKLRGLLIGDGWIDPISIYNSYLPFAIANNLVKNDSELYTNIIRLVALCQDILSKQVHIYIYYPCFSILDEIMYNGKRRENNGENSCLNVDDIRLSAKRPMCGMIGPSELEYVSTYLNRPDVMSSIHINGKKSQWKDYTESVLNAFQALNSKPSVHLLPNLLSKIPIVFYYGEYDLICNHLAAENMLDNMTWNGASGFDLGNGKIAPTLSWIVDDESAGYIRYARNLTYILFFNAGHMVPYNQARRSQAMLHQFIQLNLTYPNNQTIDSNYTKDNQNTHRSLKYIISIVCITIVVLIGIIWFLALKRQQSVSYTIVNNENDEPVTSDDDTL
ncbi:unnamed protein product [Adineta steineri]|uniref:Pheromone-processing carboxypeptidase KEX1 n=1 Tax=Adineta steineri TaxID=433720 RepID=A0A813TF48_9BILA|nr:unnamed protein product [Adineta steineri]CAF3902479.1 unnamed protein product [Adineta steineri]